MVCHVYWPGVTGTGPCATPAKIEERQSGQTGKNHKLMQVRRRYSQLENVKMFEDVASGLAITRLRQMETPIRNLLLRATNSAFPLTD